MTRTTVHRPPAPDTPPDADPIARRVARPQVAGRCSPALATRRVPRPALLIGTSQTRPPP
jgi:hypothetical protein